MGLITCHCILTQTLHYMVRILGLPYIVIAKWGDPTNLGGIWS